MNKNAILQPLRFLYGEQAEAIFARILERFGTGVQASSVSGMTQSDIVLITYGDTIEATDEKPLKMLLHFLRTYVGDAVSAVHLLPIYPYSSDDGFSVIDYRQINPELGGWEDVHELAKHYDIMLDAVINHVSRQSDWFARYLMCEEPYNRFFITCDEAADYTAVIRPRALPLLTQVETPQGSRAVWTTFSNDQIDLNYQSCELLLEVLDILLNYAKHGARFIRLDAIGFAWKRLGTTCMSLPETHALVRLLRAFVDGYAPGTQLITETNVPSAENLQYLGDGSDEASMVYQFPLPPLVMHAFISQNADYLTAWVEALPVPLGEASFFNFLASHDGIGLRPAEGILPPEEIARLVKQTKLHGGLVSYRDDGQGGRLPYELNITYMDALTAPDEDDDMRARRFLAAYMLLLSLAGVPGIYIHSLLGSRNDKAAAEKSGIPRRINRARLELNAVEQALGTPTLAATVFTQMVRLMRVRQQQPAFHPKASQIALHLDKRAFCIIREAAEQRLLVSVNVSGEELALTCHGHELLTNKAVEGTLVLKPYQGAWVVLP